MMSLGMVNVAAGNYAEALPCHCRRDSVFQRAADHRQAVTA